MKFNSQEMETIQNFFKWIDKTLNDEKKYKIGDSFIEEIETGIITSLDLGYGTEMLEFIETQYYREYYKKNLKRKKL